MPLEYTFWALYYFVFLLCPEWPEFCGRGSTVCRTTRRAPVTNYYKKLSLSHLKSHFHAACVHPLHSLKKSSFEVQSHFHAACALYNYYYKTYQQFSCRSQHFPHQKSVTFPRCVRPLQLQTISAVVEVNISLIRSDLHVSESTFPNICCAGEKTK